MAQNKKSFVLYCDIIHTMKYLSDSEKGIVFQWVLDYVNDNDPDDLPGLLQAVVEPIRQQLKRDLKKWEGYVEKQRENGKKGGRPKKSQKTQALKTKPKKADNVSVDVSVSVDENESDTVTSQISFVDFWELYDKKVGDKKKIEKKWNALSLEIQEKIIEYIPKYILAQPAKQFRKNPETFLNNKSWEDEIIERSNAGNKAAGGGTKRIGSDFSETL